MWGKINTSRFTTLSLNFTHDADFVTRVCCYNKHSLCCRVDLQAGKKPARRVHTPSCPAPQDACLCAECDQDEATRMRLNSKPGDLGIFTPAWGVRTGLVGTCTWSQAAPRCLNQLQTSWLRICSCPGNSTEVSGGCLIPLWQHYCSSPGGGLLTSWFHSTDPMRPTKHL